jgi:two-component system KDP operon response regulator KdpE
MTHIRQRLEPEPSNPRYFVTEPGLGYRFENGGGDTACYDDVPDPGVP